MILLAITLFPLTDKFVMPETVPLKVVSPVILNALLEPAIPEVVMELPVKEVAAMRVNGTP